MAQVRITHQDGTVDEITTSGASQDHSGIRPSARIVKRSVGAIQLLSAIGTVTRSHTRAPVRLGAVSHADARHRRVLPQEAGRAGRHQLIRP